MIKLVLLGGGGHCESVIEVIEQLSGYTIAGVLDPSYTDENKQKVLGYDMIGNDDDIGDFAKKGYQFVITVGQIRNANIRRRLYKTVKSFGGKLPVIVARNAHVSKHSLVKEGSIIMHFSMVNSKTSIGICSIVNTRANIEHGCVVGDFNHISTGVTLNGEVKTGSGVFIGSGSILNERCEIGEFTVIGSGSVVRNKVPSNTLAFGNPLKIIRGQK